MKRLEMKYSFRTVMAETDVDSIDFSIGRVLHLCENYDELICLLHYVYFTEKSNSKHQRATKKSIAGIEDKIDSL